MNDMNFDTGENELETEIVELLIRLDGETFESKAQSIINMYGLQKRRDNLSGNGYRIIGKWVEE